MNVMCVAWDVSNNDGVESSKRRSTSLISLIFILNKMLGRLKRKLIIIIIIILLLLLLLVIININYY